MLSRLSPVTVPEHEQHWVDRATELVVGFAATVADDDLTGELPVGHLKELSSSGLDTAFLPVEHGGEALSYVTLGAIVATIAAAHPAVATVWLMHIGASHALVTMAEPEAAAFFAGELREGRRFSNALSEPAGGNLFLSPQQDAEPAEDGWRLTGFKAFVSGSEIADYFYLNTRVDGQTAFFGVAVDESISFPPIDMTMGMRATRSRSVRLVRTPLLHRYRCGMPPADYTNLISAGFAFISIGIAESALDALKSAAVGKKSLGTPGGAATLAEASWVLSEVGMMWAELRAARLLAEQTMWLADRGDPNSMANATEAKMLANEVAKKAAALAVKVGGGSGYLQRSPIQRIFRDAQAGALMAYSVPFSQDLVGGWVLDA